MSTYGVNEYPIAIYISFILPLPLNNVVNPQLAIQPIIIGAKKLAIISNRFTNSHITLTNIKLLNCSLNILVTKAASIITFAAPIDPLFSWVKSQKPSKGWVITYKEYRRVVPKCFSLLILVSEINLEEIAFILPPPLF